MIPVSNLHHLHQKSLESDEVASVGTSQRSMNINKPRAGQKKKLFKSNSTKTEKLLQQHQQSQQIKVTSPSIKIVYRPLSARQSKVQKSSELPKQKYQFEKQTGVDLRTPFSLGNLIKGMQNNNIDMEKLRAQIDTKFKKKVSIDSLRSYQQLSTDLSQKVYQSSQKKIQPYSPQNLGMESTPSFYKQKSQGEVTRILTQGISNGGDDDQDTFDLNEPMHSVDVRKPVSQKHSQMSSSTQNKKIPTPSFIATKFQESNQASLIALARMVKSSKSGVSQMQPNSVAKLKIRNKLQ